ncbi:MAG TPA: hypothetical protein VLZ77_15725 [Acidimicrobiales bacterium]|nr:hypothetical protein [Acidimicrobiales bacterium]
MRARPVEVAAVDAVEILEALDFIAGLCAAEPDPLDDALDRFVGLGYDAPQLRLEIRALAVRLAECMRFNDATDELER